MIDRVCTLLWFAPFLIARIVGVVIHDTLELIEDLR